MIVPYDKTEYLFQKILYIMSVVLGDIAFSIKLIKDYILQKYFIAWCI